MCPVKRFIPNLSCGHAYILATMRWAGVPEWDLRADSFREGPSGARPFALPPFPSCRLECGFDRWISGGHLQPCADAECGNHLLRPRQSRKGDRRGLGPWRLCGAFISALTFSFSATESTLTDTSPSLAVAHCTVVMNWQNPEVVTGDPAVGVPGSVLLCTCVSVSAGHCVSWTFVTCLIFPLMLNICWE